MDKILEEFKSRAESSLESLKRELQGMRTNRPTPALVEGIKIEYHGENLSLKQLASIGIDPPRDLIVQVWDKEVVSGVVKAVEASELGLSLNVQGNIIRARLPELSEERREEISRLVKKTVEKYRIQVRHFRDEANKYAEKAADENVLDEDQKFRLKEKVQEETEKVNEKIEELLTNKIKEIRA